MFRDIEFMEVRGMDKLTLERLAYLYLVCERDRMILSEKEEMRFTDFRKHEFLTTFLELDDYNAYLWNYFSDRFKEKFDAIIGMIVQETEPYTDSESDWEEQEEWIAEFCRNAPESEQEWLEKWVQEKKQKLL